MCCAFVLLLILHLAQCQIASLNVTEELLKYEGYIKSSHESDKRDKGLMKLWAAESQVFFVNVTSQYRVDMTRHKEHNFKPREASQSWLECISLHELDIQKSESDYYKSERECLETANVGDRAERRAVLQVGKEIKKWRKSYRYLANQCHQDYPGDEEAAGVCLVEHMKRDKYDVAFLRLVNLKHICMGDLYIKMARISYNLEECLKSCLSRYLNVVRSIVKNNVGLCYEMKNKSQI